MRSASRLVVLCLLVGCATERPLDWTYEVPASLERPGTSVVARIRQDGCREGDPLLYESRPRSTAGRSAPLPVLMEGHTYCFEVTLFDDACSLYARATQQVEVGPEPMPRVALTLASTSEVRCDDGVCHPDRGCFRCDPETEALCPAGGGVPARCCPTTVASCSAEDAFFCETFED